MSTTNYKEEAEIWMKKLNLDEHKIKIEEYFSSIMWMNAEMFCFVVIFYLASLASP
jgi:hypothetical protein